VIYQKFLFENSLSKGSTSISIPLYFIHPLAVVDENVEIGKRMKIWHFSHVQAGAKIGLNCILGQNVYVGNKAVIGNFVKIQNNVSVYEGVILDDYVFCGPSMVFTNIPVPWGKYPQVGAAFYKPTIVKEGVSLGANSTIVCGHTIGRYAFVGAGAVVTKDIPDYTLIVGNPGRIVGWMSEAGEKLDFDEKRGGDMSAVSSKISNDERACQRYHPNRVKTPFAS
jgi:UDP-2-acetamido-3-amino-2,3-dideoxy-glucuronate N-acetyltransferase